MISLDELLNIVMLLQITEAIYPMICSTAAKTEMILTVTRRDFVNLQDRCRAVISKRVRTQQELVHLNLPPSISKYLAEAIPLSNSSQHGNSISSVDSRFRIVKKV